MLHDNDFLERLLSVVINLLLFSCFFNTASSLFCYGVLGNRDVILKKDFSYLFCFLLLSSRKFLIVNGADVSDDELHLLPTNSSM